MHCGPVYVSDLGWAWLHLSIITKCLEWQKSQLNTTNCPKRRLKSLWMKTLKLKDILDSNGFSYLYFDPSLINKTIPEIKQ
jgi:hypothetical protein